MTQCEDTVKVKLVPISLNCARKFNMILHVTLLPEMSKVPGMYFVSGKGAMVTQGCANW